MNEQLRDHMQTAAAHPETFPLILPCSRGAVRARRGNCGDVASRPRSDEIYGPRAESHLECKQCWFLLS